MWFLVIFTFLINSSISLTESESNYKKLLTQIDKNDIIQLTDKHIPLINTQNKNYSVLIFFTTSRSDHPCPNCKTAYTEFQVALASFRKEKIFFTEMFFAVADYVKAPQFFAWLRITQVPMYRLIFASNENKQYTNTKAHEIGRFIALQTGNKFKLHTPPKYEFIALLFALMVFFGSVLYLQEGLVDRLRNKKLWQIFMTLLVSFLTSGVLAVVIRGTPLIAANQDSSPMLVYPGGDFQLGFEAILLSAIYLLTSVSLALMVYEGNFSIFGGTKDIVIGAVTFSLLISVLLNTVKIKMHYYPFKFLL